MTKTLKKLMYALLGFAAGLSAGFFIEILMRLNGGGFQARTLLLGVVIGVFFGAILGLGEGISASLKRRTARGAVFGGLIGIPAGVLAIFFAQWILLLFSGGGNISLAELTSSYLPAARILGWTVLGVVLGGLDGLRSKSLRRALFGLSGGLAGGVVGGLLFEMLNLTELPAAFIRISGFSVLGILIGTGLGFADYFGRFGILKIMNGDFKGKEYIINKNSVYLGSSYRCEVFLSGDRRVKEIHARLYKDKNSGDLMISAAGNAEKIIVNDEIENQSRLKFDDVIKLGSTVLRFIP